MTILKRYKCIQSDDKRRFTVGAIYPLYKREKNYIVANNTTLWYEDEFPIIEKEYGVLLKVIDETEKSLDLNKLTIYQLKEYIDLQQALELAEKELDLKLAKKEVAKYELDEFIERRKNNV
ncbi:MAG: hypothetical protein JTJ28_02305 [Lactobacillus sp.]|nr:hypothetical protein [Lactobacillus sp.]